MNRFRLILDGPQSAVTNMATDEMLMLQQHTPQAIPTLRFYTWNEDALSLGYFQSVKDFAQGHRGHKAGTIVRRITGGGAVRHGQDLTFSLTATLPNGHIPSGVKDSYLKINEAVRVGLQALFPELDYADCRDVASMREKQRERICFEKPDCHDLLLKGRKVLGASQRRLGHRFLHQSSLTLDAPLEGLTDGILHGFKKVWGVDFELGPLSADEKTAVQHLESERYADASWCYSPVGFSLERAFSFLS